MLTLTSRRGTASSSPFTLPIAGTGACALQRRAARNVVALGDASTGVTGTWGPLGATWTIVVFLRLVRLVDDYGLLFIGNGGTPFTVLQSTTCTITLPSGGNVPAIRVFSSFLAIVEQKQQPLPTSALLANGGPLDGVEAGVPWDVPFLDHYRQLCVRNDAAGTGLRTVLVDGCVVSRHRNHLQKH